MKTLTKPEHETYMALRTGIGASDVPIIMEASPFKSAYQLWLERTGRVESDPPSEAMLAGTANEEYARKWIEDALGYELHPLAATHDEFDFIVASADGWNAAAWIGVELKCPRSSKTYDYTMQNGRPPLHYWFQICQQCAVFDPREWYFGVWHADGRTVRVSVDVTAAREQWRDEILPHLIEFNRRVEEDDWPPLSGAAEIGEIGTIAMATEIESVREDIDLMEEAKEESMSKLRLACRAKSTSFGPYKAEWRRFPEAHFVNVTCTSAEAAVRVRLALTKLENAAEVKKVEIKRWPETLRFYLSRKTDAD